MVSRILVGDMAILCRDKGKFITDINDNRQNFSIFAPFFHSSSPNSTSEDIRCL
jgi:hypothetical protein